MRMNNHKLRIAIAAFIVLVVAAQSVAPALACGPAYITPVFDYERVPEDPFLNFAAGKIGIIKPTYRRIVLIAAYRYLNGGAFSADEQKALTDVWNAEFNNRGFADTDVSEAVKKWVKVRKEVAKNEEKLPTIYTERAYGGYDFFPNCTKSAFETAAETLNDHVMSHGAEDKNVQAWLTAQDQVFNNCANGQTIPAPAEPNAPEWLKKDREYQIAAANFYSLNYETAREIWTKIAADSDSVWADTADYLIARTLVREASLAKDEAKAKAVYEQAESHLNRLTTKGGKFYEASVKLLNLVKYRTKPEERVRELAQAIARQMPNENFRQDLIDYNWLLDKFEKQALETEEKRKEELQKQQEKQNGDSNSSTNSNSNSADPVTDKIDEAANSAAAQNAQNYEKVQQGESLSVYITVAENDFRTFYFPVTKSDGEIYAEVENSIGRPLTDKEKESVQESRRESYRNKTTYRNVSGYEGGYSGSEEKSFKIVPEFLRRDELTDWLFTYQLSDEDAYAYALERWRQDKSDLWLMTALSKAGKSSADLPRLLESAERANRTSPAFPTIAYNTARIYVAQGKKAEARKFIDDILNSTLELPISSRNLFLKMRMPLAETLDEFLKYAQRRPFGFDFGGKSGTIDEIIAEQKSWYDPETFKDQTREEYEREIDERYRDEKEWQDRTMFDDDAIEVMNQHFPLAVLFEAEKSPSLPEYLRKNLAFAIWVRAVLLNDEAAAQKISPEVLRFAPEISELFAVYQAAKTPLAKRRAALYLILKNPVFTPYLESGIGKQDNEFNEWDIDDWWCAPYEMEYDEASNSEVPRRLPERPAFLSKAQSDAAQAERKKLIAIGDAPKFFGTTFIEWSRLAPNDKRVPEGLYISFRANGWTKYGCGNNIELQEQIGSLLRKRYPNSEWTLKLNEIESQ